MLLRQLLVAPNDPNGNPQKLVVVYDAGTGTGYSETVMTYVVGYGNVSDGVRDKTVELPVMRISKSEYHALVKAAQAKGKVFLCN